MSRATVEPSDVAVVVPVGGDPDAWRAAAAALAALSPPPGDLIVVVDGPDTALEKTAATLEAVGARILVLPDRGGPARARNRGVEATDRDVVLFLDADVVAPRDLVGRVVAVLTDAPSATAVMGSYDADPGSPDFLSQYRNLLHHRVHQTGRTEASTFWAGCGAVRREAFLAVGGFDAARFPRPSIEDIELGARLRRAGGSIRLEKGLQVQHLKRWRWGDLVTTDLWKRAVPWTELMLQGGGLVDDLNVTLRDRASVAAAFLPAVVLPFARVEPWLLAVVPLAAGAIAWMNRGFFGFLRRVRGTGFAVKSFGAYWVYLWICGLGFAIGTVRVLLGRRG